MIQRSQRKINSHKYKLTLYMRSVGRGQVVRVVQANMGEWWYVEDRNGVRRYVSHSCLKMYPTETGAQPQQQQPDDDPKESMQNQEP